MAGIVFFFEHNDIDVWSGREIDLDAWNYAIKAAGDIDKAIIINKTDQNIKFNCEINFNIVSEMPKLNGKIATICCPWNDADKKISLWNFNHDVDWYLFGPANGWNQKIVDLGVYIPMAGRGALHSVHVASVVLTHRYGVIS